MMDSSHDDPNKCRICLTPDANANFVPLKGSNAEMFTKVIGVELTIDGVNIESVMCQSCFSELQRSHNFRARGIRAHREYFEIQRQLASTQRRSNEQEESAGEVEPEAAAIQQMVDEPEPAADEAELPEAATIEPYLPSRIKQEPPVEFVLILPRPTSDQPEHKDDIDRKWVKLVRLTKFDAKWAKESTLFQNFLTCNHCRLVVKFQEHLTYHLKTCSKFECNSCGERFRHKSKIGEHMLKHSNERNFRCTICGKGYKSKNYLGKHRRTHEKPKACSTCHKRYATNHTLKLHQIEHRHGFYAIMQEETFNCKTCDKKFSTPNNLKQHHKNVHDQDEATCGVCEKSFKNQAYLLHHIRTHAMVECLICHKLISKHSMAPHVRSHNSRFECDFCNHSANTKGSLKQHIERRHLLKKLVKDSKCREDFSDFELLEELQLKHGSSSTFAEKKFHCDKCEKSFVTPNSLSMHKRQVHPKKLFDCEFCIKTFKTIFQLNRHKAGVHSKISVK